MDIVEEKIEETVDNQTTNSQQETIPPVFEQIEGMTQAGALNVVIQAAEMAQKAGALSVRDSVLLAKAISVLRPGSI